jgi:WD40 repeat protein
VRFDILGRRNARPRWRIYRGGAPRVIHEAYHTPETILDICLSPDGQLLASASSDRTVRLWNPATGEQVQKLEGHSGLVSAAAFSSDGQLLASASGDRTVRLWNPATGEQVQKLEQGNIVRQLRFSSDSQCLETDKGILRLYSCQSTAPLLL